MRGEFYEETLKGMKEYAVMKNVKEVEEYIDRRLKETKGHGEYYMTRLIAILNDVLSMTSYCALPSTYTLARVDLTNVKK